MRYQNAASIWDFQGFLTSGVWYGVSCNTPRNISSPSPPHHMLFENGLCVFLPPVPLCGRTDARGRLLVFDFFCEIILLIKSTLFSCSIYCLYFWLHPRPAPRTKLLHCRERIFLEVFFILPSSKTLRSIICKFPAVLVTFPCFWGMLQVRCFLK